MSWCKILVVYLCPSHIYYFPGLNSVKELANAMRMSCWLTTVQANVIRTARAPWLEWLAQVLGLMRLSTDCAGKGQDAMLCAGHNHWEWRGLLWKLQPGVCIVARLWGDLRNRFNANGMGWDGGRSSDYKCTGEACDSNLIRVQNTTVCYNIDFPTWETLDEPSCESSLFYIIKICCARPGIVPQHTSKIQLMKN